MNKGKTIFSQLIDFLFIRKFRRCFERYKGNYRVRSFTCYDQLLCMAFAQLTYRESLRVIECYLRAVRDKLYHMILSITLFEKMPILQAFRAFDHRSITANNYIQLKLFDS